MANWVRRLAWSVAFLAGCANAPETSDTSGPGEEVGTVSQATTSPSSCSSAPLPGECRYTPTQAFASSVECNDSAYVAGKAIDGDCGSRWSSAFSDPQWLKVDLGASRPLSRLVIHWENAASSSYELQVSDDAANWTRIATKANATIAGSGNSRVDTIAGLSATARYVRLYSLARTTTYGNSIFELEVFGTGCSVAPGCSQIPVAPTGASASSQENSVKGPDRAIDGNPTTRWSSAFSDPQWLQLDLGQTRSVGRVSLDWENAASAKYQIQVSDSPTGPWTVLHTHQDSHVGPRTDDITGLNGSGRYLRIHSTQRATAYGNSLFEVRVFRSSCTGCEQVLVPTATAASSSESSAHVASKAVDGDYSTRWSSQFSDPQWLRLDFGQDRRVNQVMIRWEGAASKNYRLEGATSANGPWTTLAQRSNQPSGPRWDFITGLDASARFLRVYSTARTSTYGNSIHEIVALGSSTQPPCSGRGQCVEDNPPGQRICSCDQDASGPDCSSTIADIACPSYGTKTCVGDVCTCTTTVLDDDNFCTDDLDNGDGTFSHVPEALDAFCFGPGGCSGSARCDGKGFCVCTSSTEDDNNPCSLDEPGATPGTFTHTTLPDGTACDPAYACEGEGRCVPDDNCVCHTVSPVDSNPCTQARNCDGPRGCLQQRRSPGVLCSGENFCNGECTLSAECECDAPPVPDGFPIRMGTFNTQFLANTPFDAAETGHGFAGCEPGFFGGTDHECLAKKLVPKIQESEYDFIVLNEVFSDTAREHLALQLQGDLNVTIGPYPVAIEELDGGGLFNWSPEVDQDSGLMLLSKWQIDEITDEDRECFPDADEVRIEGKQLENKAVGFIVYDDASAPDNLAQKGIAWARLVAPNGARFALFFSHTQAGYASADYEDWLEDGLETRANQFDQVVEIMDCLREKNTIGSNLLIPRAEFLLGDLNINGDLSNLAVDRNDAAQLSPTCSSDMITCAQRLANGTLNPPNDTCVQNRDGSSIACFDVKLSQERRNQNRGEWDSYFNNKGGAPAPRHAFHNRMTDLWASSMTPAQCIPAFGAADPTCPVIDPSDVFDLGFDGLADYDRGFTDFDSEDRLDYVLMNDRPLDDQCAQHLTKAWNLLADQEGKENYEGGLSQRSNPSRFLGGHQTISDHFGLNAELNKKGEHCNPTHSLLAPEITDPVNTPTGEIALQMEYRGAVHWIRIEQPGTYSFNVNPVNHIPHGGVFGDVEYDNGLTYRVYEKTDLSRPMLPHKGEVRSVPPEQNCTSSDSGVRCWEVPGYKEARFHVPQPPFYVKVFHPSRDYSTEWHGQYRFLYRRSRCSTQEEACGLVPFEGVAPSDAAMLTGAREFPPNSGQHQWFFLHTDAPDGNTTQALQLAITEAEITPDSAFEKVEILRADTLDPVLTIDSPVQDAAGRWRWALQDTAGLLDLDNNPQGLERKFFVRIARKADVDDTTTRFWVAWETPLTWLYGPDLGGSGSMVRCSDTTDALSDDEVYMQIVADGVRYPLGARHGAAPDGAVVDTSMDEDDQLDWTAAVFPRLGNNSHGQAFGAQAALKFVTAVDLQLHEDDDTFTLGDDTSGQTINPLGPVLGARPLPNGSWFGGDYSLTGGSMSHERPGKPCQTDDDCDDPLICRGFCRQAQ